MTAKLATLQDPCTSKNTTLWTYPAGTSQAGSQMHVAAGNTGGSPNYVSNVSAVAYDLTASSIFCRVQVAAGGSGPVTNLTLRSTQVSNGTDLTMAVVNGALQCMSRTGFADGSASSAPYNPATMAWWRIRESNGSTYFETSPDGVNWTVRRSIATPSYATSVWVAPSANNNSGTSTDSLWTNFSTGTGNPKVATLTDSFAAYDATKWNQQDPAAITYAGGAVCITAAVSGLPNITAVQPYDLISSGIFAKLVPPTGASGGSTEMVLYSPVVSNNLRWVYWEDTGNIYAQNQINWNSDSGQVVLPYNPAQHAFFKISESGGTISWSTSPDGVNWIVQRTMPTSSISYASQVTPAFSAEASTTASTTPAKWSNLNSPAVSIVSVVNPGPQVFTRFALQIVATDSVPGQDLTYSATGLPPCTSIDPETGLITGNPVTPGTYTVTVTVTDPSGSSGSATFPLVVNSSIPQPVNTVTVTSPGPQSAVAGTAVALHISAADSAPGQVFSFTAAGLPSGLSINPATGMISGTPTTAGSYTVTVTATDTTGATGSTTFTWTVASTGPANTVTVTNPGPQSYTTGVPVSLQIAATDSASQALTYSASGLPPGLSINTSTGMISGTPTTAGTYTPVVVTAMDTGGASGSVSFAIVVSLPVPPPQNTVTVANPGARASQTGVAVSLQITAKDSAAGQKLAYTAQNLPPGLSISASGLITGTPTVAGTYNPVTVFATDTTGASGSASFSWAVSTPVGGGSTLPPPGGTSVTVDFRTTANGNPGPIVPVNALGVGITISGFSGAGQANITKSAAWLQMIKNLAPDSCRVPWAWFGGNPGAAPGSGKQPGTSAAYLSAIAQIGAIPYLIYSGDTSDNGINATDAAALVHYYNDNGGQHGAPAGGLKFLVIGNEPDNGDPTNYKNIVGGIVSAVHGADPTVKCSVPAAASWDTSLLTSSQILNSGLDIMSYHAYDAGDPPPPGGDGFPQTSQYHANILSMKGYKAGLFAYGLEEFNWNYASAGPQNWQNTVWMADVIGQTLSAGGHAIMYADSNGQLGLMNDGQAGLPGAFLTPLPAYWAVGIWTGVGQFFKHSGSMVPASTTYANNTLTAYACDNGKIVLINKDTAAHPVTIGMGGKVSGTYAVHATQQGNPTGPIKQVAAEAAYANQVINYTVPAGTAVSIDVS